MNTEIFGWCGRILRIDLSNAEITELETMDYASRFLGGRGIATRLYWEEVRPEIGALDPGNCLILMSGPLVATGAQGASRFEVVGYGCRANPASEIFIRYMFSCFCDNFWLSRIHFSDIYH